jgi:hypothetical protein
MLETRFYLCEQAIEHFYSPIGGKFLDQLSDQQLFVLALINRSFGNLEQMS